MLIVLLLPYVAVNFLFLAQPSDVIPDPEMTCMTSNQSRTKLAPPQGGEKLAGKANAPKARLMKCPLYLLLQASVHSKCSVQPQLAHAQVIYFESLGRVRQSFAFITSPNIQAGPRSSL